MKGPNKAPSQLPTQMMGLSNHALLSVSSILTIMNAYLPSFLFLVILLTNTSEKVPLIHRSETHHNCFFTFIFINVKKNKCILNCSIDYHFQHFQNTNSIIFLIFHAKLMHQGVTKCLTQFPTFPLILTTRSFLYMVTDYNLFM